MARNAKSPITLNSVLIRYLEDIEEGQNARLVNKNIEPYEMFTVNILIEGEAYPDQHQETLEVFKRYFIKEKILRFPSLQEFATKYGLNWTTTSVLDTTQTDRHTLVTFERFLPVEVLDLAKLKAFRKIYGKVHAPVASIVTKRVSGQITDFHPKTRTVTKEGVPPYTFQDKLTEQESLTIFRDLWNNRRHLVDGKIRQKGIEDNFGNFAARTHLISDRMALRDRKTLNRLLKKTRSVISNILRKHSFPMKLSCGKGRVLLTVSD